MDVAITGLITHLESRQYSSRFEHGTSGEYYLSLSPAGLSEAACYLANHGGMALIDVWAAPGSKKNTLELFYAFEIKHPSPVLIVTIEIENNQAPSISEEFPVAIYLERRVSDFFGLLFTGLPDTRRLFLHEIYPANFYPMIESSHKHLNTCINPADAPKYVFKSFEGDGLYQVPVGPVHAGVIEPGHFRFSVIGETIFNLELRLGYKHRGLNKLAEGKRANEAIKLAEAVSGDESAVNACCFAAATEKVAGVEIPRRAWELRTILLEMERIYSHLGDLAGMLIDVAYPVGASPLLILREEILRWNAVFTGSRFLKDAIIPGGLKQDIKHQTLDDFKQYLNIFSQRLEKALSIAYNSAWVIDRFETTGIVSPALVAPLSLSGPTARASGYDMDTRKLHPYGIYNEFGYNIPISTSGDVLARFNVKAEEAVSSINLLHKIIAACSLGPVFVECRPESGTSLAIAEAPRGRNLHWLRYKEGKVERWEVITASFCNWLAIEHAVIDNIVPDFPVINKSFNLSYSGNDL